MRALTGLIVWLWAAVCSAGLIEDATVLIDVTHSSGRYLGSGTHVGGGYVLTCYHTLDGYDWHAATITIDGHPISPDEWHVAPNSDLALLHCAGIAGQPQLHVAESSDDLFTGQVTIAGHPRGAANVQTIPATLTSSAWRYTGDDDPGKYGQCLEVETQVESGMSGGAVVNEHMEIVGVVVTANVSGLGSGCVSGPTFHQFIRNCYQVCPIYRPILHVWTRNPCEGCRQFWADFDTDADFRNTLMCHFRFPMRPDGTVNKEAYNVDRHPVLSVTWGITSLPTFGVNPASRVIGYYPSPDGTMDRKGYLLWRLGIIAAETPTPSQPPPTQQQPTPAIIESTGPGDSCANCAERFRALDLRLQAMESRISSLVSTVEGLAGTPAPTVDLSELEAEIASLRAEMLLIELTPGPPGPQGPQGLQGPPGRDGEERTITVIIEDDDGNRLAAPVEVPPTASTVRIPIERFVREGN